MDTFFNAIHYRGNRKNSVRVSVSRLGIMEWDAGSPGRLSVPFGQTNLELIGDPQVTLQLSWSDAEGQHALLCREPALIEQLLTLDLTSSVRDNLLKLQGRQQRCLRRDRQRVPFYLGITVASLLVVHLAINRSAPFVADTIPYEWERKIGGYALENYKIGKTVIDDQQVNDAIDTVLRRIDQFDGAELDYQLTVVDADMVNAFAFPGGYVVVTTGLIKQADAPEEVAAVLAHELTHVLQRHSMRKLVRQAGVGVVLGIVFGDASALSRLIELSAQLNSLAFDRDQERQADEGAVKILLDAGIPPKYLGRFFEKIKKVDMSVGSIPELFRTHPLTDERIKRLSDAVEPTQTFHFDLDWQSVRQELQESKGRLDTAN